jgi:hypothetical protein
MKIFLPLVRPLAAAMFSLFAAEPTDAKPDEPLKNPTATPVRPRSIRKSTEASCSAISSISPHLISTAAKPAAPTSSKPRNTRRRIQALQPRRLATRSDGKVGYPWNSHHRPQRSRQEYPMRVTKGDTHLDSNDSEMIATLAAATNRQRQSRRRLRWLRHHRRSLITTTSAKQIRGKGLDPALRTQSIHPAGSVQGSAPALATERAGPSKHAALSAKITNRAMRNAAGVLIVNGPLSRESERDENGGRGIGAIGDFTIPVLHHPRRRRQNPLARRQKLTDIQAAIGGNRPAVRSNPRHHHRRDLTSKSKRKPLSTSSAVLKAASENLKRNGTSARTATTSAWQLRSLAGKDGAGKIHPGADDNASGTSGMLRSPNTWSAEARRTPQTTVIMMAFLRRRERPARLGVLHGTSQDAAQDISAMVNLDMIGRSKRRRVDHFRHGSRSVRCLCRRTPPIANSPHFGSAGDGPSDTPASG